jgi:hypothetical protein
MNHSNISLLETSLEKSSRDTYELITSFFFWRNFALVNLQIKKQFCTVWPQNRPSISVQIFQTIIRALFFTALCGCHFRHDPVSRVKFRVLQENNDHFFTLFDNEEYLVLLSESVMEEVEWHASAFNNMIDGFDTRVRELLMIVCNSNLQIQAENILTRYCENLRFFYRVVLMQNS